MEQNIITDTFLPLGLAIIMLGMGLGLKPEDFKRVVKYPKAVTIGLLNQVVLLPIIAFLLLGSFSLRPELAIGIMILSACPGGPTSNLITHLCKGDVALSVTLTALATFITLFTLPYVVGFSISYFSKDLTSFELPVTGLIIKLLIMAVAPVIAGMVIRSVTPSLARKADKPVRIMSGLLLSAIIAGVIIREKDHIITFFVLAGPVSFSLNVATLLLGYLTSRMFGIDHRQSITVSIESGIQNGTLAIFIAASLLKDPIMTIAPAIYSLTMFFTAGIIIAIALKGSIGAVRPARQT